MKRVLLVAVFMVYSARSCQSPGDLYTQLARAELFCLAIAHPQESIDKNLALCAYSVATQHYADTAQLSDKLAQLIEAINQGHVDRLATHPNYLKYFAQIVKFKISINTEKPFLEIKELCEYLMKIPSQEIHHTIYEVKTSYCILHKDRLARMRWYLYKHIDAQSSAHKRPTLPHTFDYLAALEHKKESVLRRMTSHTRNRVTEDARAIQTFFDQYKTNIQRDFIDAGLTRPESVAHMIAQLAYAPAAKVARAHQASGHWSPQSVS